MRNQLFLQKRKRETGGSIWLTSSLRKRKVVERRETIGQIDSGKTLLRPPFSSFYIPPITSRGCRPHMCLFYLSRVWLRWWVRPSRNDIWKSGNVGLTSIDSEAIATCIHTSPMRIYSNSWASSTKLKPSLLKFSLLRLSRAYPHFTQSTNQPHTLLLSTQKKKIWCWGPGSKSAKSFQTLLFVYELKQRTDT